MLSLTHATKEYYDNYMNDDSRAYTAATKFGTVCRSIV